MEVHGLQRGIRCFPCSSHSERCAASSCHRPHSRPLSSNTVTRFSQSRRLERQRSAICSAEAQSRKEERLPKEIGDKWSVATVVENKAVSADGTLRTLVLSVEDKVVFLEGRSMHRKQERPRWVDAYTVPGQVVAVRLSSQEASESADLPQPSNSGPHLFAITSSPYAVRRESADLDASIIEVLVDRQGDKLQQYLAQLGPGHLVEVSNVVGRGFSSLFDSHSALLSVLEDSRNLLLVGTGAAGIAPLRAVLEWAPVQAHATAHKVTLLYACPSATSAAFLKDWDSWRDAGVVVKPLYLENGSGNGNGSISKEALQERLLDEILGGEQGLSGTVGGDPREAAALLSGLPGSVAAAISKELTSRGVDGERVLFCDYL